MNFNFLLILANIFNKILFYNVFGLPILVILLLLPSIYFSIKLEFPNIKFFKHAIDVIKGKFYSEENKGFITPKQSLFIMISSSVGLGAISGTAIAIVMAGPGSLFWMVIMAFLSMNVSFVESILSIKYRKINKAKNTIEAGAPRYLRFGLAEARHKKIGFILSLAYSFLSIIGMISAGAIYQSFELTNILTKYECISNYRNIVIIIIAVLMLFIMLGGTSRCSSILSKLSPIVVTILSITIISSLIVNITKIPEAIIIIIKDAFNFKSVTGGFIGTLVMGIRRSGMSNEAGMGTSSIAPATAKTQHPVQQACVSSLNPFISTIIFSFLIGLVIITSGVYLEPNSGNGVILASNAFAKTSKIFPYLITFITVIITTSVMINTYFCVSNVWLHLFGYKSKYFLYLVYTIAILSINHINFNDLIIIADNFFLAISIPNIIGLFMLRNIIRKEIRQYKRKFLNKMK